VSADAFHAATPPERLEAMRRSVSLGRLGTPGDCVGAFLFLPRRSERLRHGADHSRNGGQVMP